MAAFGAVDVSVVLAIGNTNYDLSSYTKNVNLVINGADLDTTGMGTTNNNFHTRISGLRDWSGTLEFVQDFAASQVNVALVTAVFQQTNGYVLTIKPTSAAVGVGNPRFFGNILLDYDVFGGGAAVGTLAMAKATFVGASALTYATT